MMTNLPVFDGIEAFVDAEVSTVERVVSPADDLLQLGHVPLQLRVDVLVRVQHGHVMYWSVYSTATSCTGRCTVRSRHGHVMYWSCTGPCTVRSRHVLVGVQYGHIGRCRVRSRRVLVRVQHGHVVYWSVYSTVTSSLRLDANDSSALAAPSFSKNHSVSFTVNSSMHVKNTDPRARWIPAFCLALRDSSIQLTFPRTNERCAAGKTVFSLALRDMSIQFLFPRTNGTLVPSHSGRQFRPTGIPKDRLYRVLCLAVRDNSVQLILPRTRTDVGRAGYQSRPTPAKVQSWRRS